MKGALACLRCAAFAFRRPLWHTCCFAVECRALEEQEALRQRQLEIATDATYHCVWRMLGALPASCLPLVHFTLLSSRQPSTPIYASSTPCACCAPQVSCCAACWLHSWRRNTLGCQAERRRQRGQGQRRGWPFGDCSWSLVARRFRSRRRRHCALRLKTYRMGCLLDCLPKIEALCCCRSGSSSNSSRGLLLLWQLRRRHAPQAGWPGGRAALAASTTRPRRRRCRCTPAPPRLPHRSALS